MLTKAIINDMEASYAAAFAHYVRMIITLACFLLILAPQLFSAPLMVGGSFTGQKIGPHLDYYMDKSGTATIRDVSSHKYRKNFRPLPKKDYSFGYSDTAIWLRSTIMNKTGRNFSWLLECEYPLIDDICLYEPQGGGYSPTCTGDRRPFGSRPVEYRTFVFPVDSPPGESVCYLRITSSGALNVAFMAWDPASFQKMKERESILIWMFYGVMISLIIYNLFIFISVRELSYLYLSMFTISVSLFSMCHTGLAYQYLWPAYPTWGNISHPFFSIFSAILVIQFTRTFLSTRRYTPRCDRALQVFLAIGIVLTISLLIIAYRLATQITTLFDAVLALFLIANGTYQLIIGSRQARFYMAAWIFFMIGIILTMLRAFGFLHEAFLANWGYQIGSSLVLIILSLGIADKINIMRHEREEALDDIREAEEKYRALIETTDTGYVILDENGFVLDANAEYVRMSGYLTVNDIINRNVTEWTSPGDREKNARADESCMQHGFIRNLEIDYVQKNGTVIPVEINATVIDSKEGKHILSICHDFTYRKTVLNNLQTSLREKEILLKEIHHRVKNNLQIISSLIGLQSSKITDHEELKLYEDLSSRIRAMSLIHERLYQSNDFAHIDFAEYIRLMTHDIQSVYRLYCGNCIVEYNIDPIELDIVKAIPCGLMLNEILSNTFKYAFPPTFSGQGIITVSFHELDNNNIELAVSDNGIGMPGSIDPVKIETLGLSLIFLLADQINGSIRIDRNGGTRYTVTFNKA